MSLREEIVAEIISLAGNDWLGWEDNLIEKANFITRNYQNKVLNAAVEAVRPLEHCDFCGGDYLVSKSEAIEAINKLRGD